MNFNLEKILKNHTGEDFKSWRGGCIQQFCMCMYIAVAICYRHNDCESGALNFELVLYRHNLWALSYHPFPSSYPSPFTSYSIPIVPLNLYCLVFLLFSFLLLRRPIVAPTYCFPSISIISRHLLSTLSIVPYYILPLLRVVLIAYLLLCDSLSRVFSSLNILALAQYSLLPCVRLTLKAHSFLPHLISVRLGKTSR